MGPLKRIISFAGGILFALSVFIFLQDPFFFGFSVKHSYAMDTENSFHGVVYDIDFDVSMVIVRRNVEEDPENFEEINCFVDKDTKVMKDEKEIGMDGLSMGDKVYVELGENRENEKVALLIVVENTKEEQAQAQSQEE